MRRNVKITVLLLTMLLAVVPLLSACGAGGEDDGADGLANPWSDAADLAEAAKGAGLDGFSVPEEAEISLGAVTVSQCRYMEGIAEATVDFPASMLTIRKGLASAAAEEGDISGDYTEYAKTWTQNIKGLEVTCFGDKEDAAAKII